jgi:hypothetical protein
MTSSDLSDRHNRVNNDWNLARKEFLKTKYKNNHSKKIIFADKEICMPKKRPHCYFNFKPTDDSSKL